MPPIRKNAGANPARIAGIMDNMDVGSNMVGMGFAKKRLSDRVAVPLRSNYTRYGPFAYIGPPGQVNMVRRFFESLGIY